MNVLSSLTSHSTCSTGGLGLSSATKVVPCKQAPCPRRSSCRSSVASGNKGSLGSWRTEQQEIHMQPMQAVAAPSPPMLTVDEHHTVLAQQEQSQFLRSLTQQSSTKEHSHTISNSEGTARNSEVLSGDFALSAAEIADMWEFVINTRTEGLLAGHKDTSSTTSAATTPVATEAHVIHTSPAKWTTKQPLQPKVESKPLLTDADAAMADPIAACVTAGLWLAKAEESYTDAQQQEVPPTKFPHVRVVKLSVAGPPSSKAPRTLLVLDPLNSPCVIYKSDVPYRRTGQLRAADFDEKYNKEWEAAAWAEHHAEVARRAAGASVDSSADESYMGTDETGTDEEEPERTPAATAAAAPDSGSSNNRSSHQPEEPQMMKMDIKVQCITQPGERVWLVGEGDLLGNWKAEAALKMKWGEGHKWSTQVAVPKGSWLRYKALLQAADGSWQWERGFNHELLVSKDESLMHAFQ